MLAFNLFLTVYNTLIYGYLSYHFLVANNMKFAVIWGLSAVVYSPAIYYSWKAYKG